MLSRSISLSLSLSLFLSLHSPTYSPPPAPSPPLSLSSTPLVSAPAGAGAAGPPPPPAPLWAADRRIRLRSGGASSAPADPAGRRGSDLIRAARSCRLPGGDFCGWGFGFRGGGFPGDVGFPAVVVWIRVSEGSLGRIRLVDVLLLRPDIRAVGSDFLRG